MCTKTRLLVCLLVLAGPDATPSVAEPRPLALPGGLAAGVRRAVEGATTTGGTAEQLAERVRLRDGFAAAALRRAIQGARRRLEEPACQQIFEEFRDEAGHSLSQRLAERGGRAEAQLAHLLFYDGNGQPRCDDTSVAAITTPGAAVVLICSDQFAKLQRRGRRDAELLVIHELLHTLGLGENPPTPSEIDARVEARCAS